MIKCLYAGGDSWTEGDELGLPWDDISTPVYRYNNSWPKLLADKLKATCFNDGLRGTSGTRIFRRATRFMHNWCKTRDANDLLVVVCWTTLDRDELPIDVVYPSQTVPYYIPYHYYKYNMPHMSKISSIDNMVKQTIEKMHPLYTVTLGDESRAEMQYERMQNLKHIANSLGVNLIQTFALDCPHFDNNQKNFRSDWQKEIQYYPIQFNNFCRQNNIPLASGGHCLEEGHQQWAEQINELYTNNIKP